MPTADNRKANADRGAKLTLLRRIRFPLGDSLGDHRVTELVIKSVLFRIDDFASPRCYASEATIADAAGCSVKSVERGIKVLLEKKIIVQVEDSEYGSNAYVINWTEIKRVVAAQAAASAGKRSGTKRRRYRNADAEFGIRAPVTDSESEMTDSESEMMDSESETIRLGVAQYVSETEFTNASLNANSSANSSSSQKRSEPSADCDEVVAVWNATVGVKPIRSLTADRRSKLRTRLLDPNWPWREAMERLPLPGDGWQPDFDWMLKNATNALSIVEGKFDFRATLHQKRVSYDSRNQTTAKRGSLFAG